MTHALILATLAGQISNHNRSVEEQYARIFDLLTWGVSIWWLALVLGLVAMLWSFFARRRRKWFAILGALAVFASVPGILAVYAALVLCWVWELEWRMTILLTPTLFGLVSLVRWKLLPKTNPYPLTKNQVPITHNP